MLKIATNVESQNPIKTEGSNNNKKANSKKNTKEKKKNAVEEKSSPRTKEPFKFEIFEDRWRLIGPTHEHSDDIKAWDRSCRFERFKDGKSGYSFSRSLPGNVRGAIQEWVKEKNEHLVTSSSPLLTSSLSSTPSPSSYQKKIYDWVRYSEGHAIIQSVAGSGK